MWNMGLIEPRATFGAGSSSCGSHELWACGQLLGPQVAPLNRSWYCSVLKTVVLRRALSSQTLRWSVYRHFHFLGRLLHAGDLWSEAGGQSHRPWELCAGLAAQVVCGPHRERRRREAPRGS